MSQFGKDYNRYVQEELENGHSISDAIERSIERSNDDWHRDENADNDDIILQMLQDKYMGQPYTKEAILDIESHGYSPSLDCRTGMIGYIYKPRFPGLATAKLIEL